MSSAFQPGNGVAAHRGNMSVFPENTMEAFESAVAVGADWIELDIQSTADGKIVVTHDASTLRVTGDNLVVQQTDFSRLRQLNFGAFAADGKTYRLPLLAEVFELAAKSGVRITIQPKCNGVVKPAVDLAKSAGVLSQIAFNELNCEYLVEAKRNHNAIPVFWDRLPGSDIETDIYIAKTLGFDCLMYVLDGLKQETIDRVRSSGLECGVCVVNDPGDMDKYLSWGVKMFYTDYPELLLKKK